jgi:cytochrome bd ubiquinol oxidase subunit II
MTLMISHLFLQQYWWVIISLMASILVFLMFVQGGQTMIFTLPGNDSEKSMIINALGRKWEFTFTTLVTFGGTFFASFPLFYATSFGGAYWVWTIILFCFIIQAVSYEFRSKAGNIFGKNTFDSFLMINGSLGPFLIGCAVSTFFTGSQFSLNEMNQVTWQTPWYGLEALADFRNLALGFAVLFLSRINGLFFLINTIDNEAIRNKAQARSIVNSLVFLIFFLYFLVSILLSDGYAYDASGKISAVDHKYLNNFVEMPVIIIVFLTGVIGVLYGIAITVFKKSIKGIWFTGTGTILAVFALFIISGFNGTSFYPSVHDPKSSLTISNASSSYFTLKTMMFFSFVIPFIFTYIWYTWKALTSKKITEEEMKMNSDAHKY